MSIQCAVAPNLSVPHIEMPVAYATDWDGNAGIVAQNLALLQEVAKPWVSPQTIEAARAYAYTHDGNFDPLREVVARVTPEQFDVIGELFIANSTGRPTIYRDVADYYRRIEDTGAANLALTHGTNPLWQLSKIACGVRQAAKSARTRGATYVEVITGAKEKGPHLEDMRGLDGTFDFLGLDENGEPIAVIHARSIELHDDRPYSHEGLPTDARGKLVKRPEAHASRRDEMVGPELQDRVQVVQGLSEVCLLSTVTLTDCVDADRPYTAPVGFRPAYPRGNAKPGTLITPSTPFRDLRQAAERQKVRT